MATVAQGRNQAKILIKERLDIGDFFSQRGFALRADNSRLWTLCPFHNEKTGSFCITPATGRYYCFGCKESGDVFTYLEKKEGLSFTEAVDTLAQQLGITIAENNVSREETDKRLRYMKLVSDVWDYWRTCYDGLPENHVVKAHEIRDKRGISSSAHDNYDLFGWSPNGNKTIDYLHSRGYSDEDMLAVGVARKNKDNGSLYSAWRERLMFPIKDVLGKVVGFTGRLVFDNTQGQVGKYVNSPESLIYHKSDVMFCHNIARKQSAHDKEVFIVEGQFDVLALQHSGKTNAVAVSGSTISFNQARSLQRMVGATGRLVFVFDSDSAGMNASIKAWKNIGSLQSQSYVASMPQGLDPSDTYKTQGQDGVLRALSTTIPLWEHIVRSQATLHDVSHDVSYHEYIAVMAHVYDSTYDSAYQDNIVNLIALLSGKSVLQVTADIEHVLGLSSQRAQSHDDGESNTEYTIGITQLPQQLNSADIYLLSSCIELIHYRSLASLVDVPPILQPTRDYIATLGESPLILEKIDDDTIRMICSYIMSSVNDSQALAISSPYREDNVELMKQRIEVQAHEVSRRKIESQIGKLSSIASSGHIDMTILRRYESKMRELRTTYGTQCDEYQSRLLQQVDSINAQYSQTDNDNTSSPVETPSGDVTSTAKYSDSPLVANGENNTRSAEEFAIQPYEPSQEDHGSAYTAPVNDIPYDNYDPYYNDNSYGYRCNDYYGIV